MMYSILYNTVFKRIMYIVHVLNYYNKLNEDECVQIIEELGAANAMSSLLNFYWNSWEIGQGMGKEGCSNHPPPPHLSSYAGGIRKDRNKQVCKDDFALVSQFVLTSNQSWASISNFVSDHSTMLVRQKASQLLIFMAIIQHHCLL
jgi:hypothetical protein